MAHDKEEATVARARSSPAVHRDEAIMLCIELRLSRAEAMSTDVGDAAKDSSGDAGEMLKLLGVALVVADHIELKGDKSKEFEEDMRRIDSLFQFAK
eukprot:131558-Pyramimonas_sp.AAC.1